MEIYTIGFTQSTAEHFFGRLANAGVGRLLDVRLNNRSQLAGFAKAMGCGEPRKAGADDKDGFGRRCGAGPQTRRGNGRCRKGSLQEAPAARP